VVGVEADGIPDEPGAPVDVKPSRSCVDESEVMVICVFVFVGVSAFVEAIAVVPSDVES
jgi:hypothetical protein